MPCPGSQTGARIHHPIIFSQGPSACPRRRRLASHSKIQLFIYIFIQNTRSEHQTCAGHYPRGWGFSREENDVDPHSPVDSFLLLGFLGASNFLPGTTAFSPLFPHETPPCTLCAGPRGRPSNMTPMRMMKQGQPLSPWQHLELRVLPETSSFILSVNPHRSLMRCHYYPSISVKWEGLVRVTWHPEVTGR